MRLIAEATGIAAVLAILAPAAVQAQETQHHIYGINNRLEIDRRPTTQLRMDRGHGADSCIMGPSFNFRSDPEAWVRNNLRAGVGGPCGCR